MRLRIVLLLALLIGLFFTISGNQRPVRRCIPEFAARRQAEKVVMPDYPSNTDSTVSKAVVLAAVLFDERGKMVKANVYESPGPEFAEAVTRALEQWKLTLVYDSTGRPVETKTAIRFHFIFEDGKGRVEAASVDEQMGPRDSAKVCNTGL